MNKKDLFEFITAFADNEILDPIIRNQIETLIEKDPECKYEYEIQIGIKNLLKKSCFKVEMPEVLKEKILFSIRNYKTSSLQNLLENIKLSFIDIFRSKSFNLKYAYIFFIFFFFSIATFFTFRFYSEKIDKLSFEEIKENYYDPENYFCQAAQNFKLILEGKLSPQIICRKPDQLKSFFYSNGVAYEIFIPYVENWTLIGGVISETKGKKHAHFIYQTKNDNLIYVYQVSKDCIEKNKTLKLSNKLMNYLKKHNYISLQKNSFYIYAFKLNNNYTIAVTNENLDESNNKFKDLVENERKFKL